jgi:hypothetical protein
MFQHFWDIPIPTPILAAAAPYVASHMLQINIIDKTTTVRPRDKMLPPEPPPKTTPPACIVVVGEN